MMQPSSSPNYTSYQAMHQHQAASTANNANFAGGSFIQCFSLFPGATELLQQLKGKLPASSQMAVNQILADLNKSDSAQR